MSINWQENLFLTRFSCPECGPSKSPRLPHQAPWWKGACSCSTVMATASRTIQSDTTTTPSCPWTGCDSVACCVTLCFMSPTKKSRRTKWCWHPAAPTSMLCLPVSSVHDFIPVPASCFSVEFDDTTTHVCSEHHLILPASSLPSLLPVWGTGGQMRSVSVRFPPNTSSLWVYNVCQDSQLSGFGTQLLGSLIWPFN